MIQCLIRPTLSKQDSLAHAAECTYYTGACAPQPTWWAGSSSCTISSHSSLRALWSEGELQADWEWFLTKMFELDHKGATCTWTRGEEPTGSTCWP
jgi:hypothetical protein